MLQHVAAWMLKTSGRHYLNVCWNADRVKVHD